MRERMTARHQMAAVLLATGRPATEVGPMVGVHPNRITTWRQSPLFQALLTQAQRDIRDRMVGALVEDLQAMMAADAPTNMRHLQHLRSHARSEAVQLGAAGKLLDKQMPTVTQHDETKTVRIQLGNADVSRLLRTLAEVGEPGAYESVVPSLAAGDPDEIVDLDDAVSRLQAEADHADGDD